MKSDDPEIDELVYVGYKPSQKQSIGFIASFYIVILTYAYSDSFHVLFGCTRVEDSKTIGDSMGAYSGHVMGI